MYSGRRLVSWTGYHKNHERRKKGDSIPFQVEIETYMKTKKMLRICVLHTYPWKFCLIEKWNGIKSEMAHRMIWIGIH